MRSDRLLHSDMLVAAIRPERSPGSRPLAKLVMRNQYLPDCVPVRELLMEIAHGPRTGREDLADRLNRRRGRDRADQQLSTGAFAVTDHLVPGHGVPALRAAG